MFTKSTIIALLASASLAFAAPSEDKRTAANSLNFVNHTPSEIEYALVGPNGDVSRGSIQASTTKNLPVPPMGQGYSLKLAAAGQNPSSSSGILQLEYSLGGDSNVYFDWSAVNGNPEPFSKFARSIMPARPGGACQPISCKAGQDDSSCESVVNSKGQVQRGPLSACPAFGGVIFTATIG